MSFVDPTGLEGYGALQVVVGCAKVIGGAIGAAACATGTAALAADDVTGVGVVDDVAIPFTIAGTVACAAAVASGVADIVEGISSSSRTRADALPTTISETDTDTESRLTLFHYSNSSEWRGDTFPTGYYLTDNPTYSSEQARQLLALPNVNEGTQLYLYKFTVTTDQVTPPRLVQPKVSNTKPDEVLPGGGTEYNNTEPLLMEQSKGVPVKNE